MAGNSQTRTPWWLSLWPGLRGTWTAGRLSSLVVAIVSGCAAQLVVVVCFVWPEMLQQPLPTVVCFGVVLFWCGYGAWDLVGQRRRQHISLPIQTDALFQSAQLEYLKGDRAAAERTLTRLLSKDADDVEARLLLATIYRHLNRTDEASRELDLLETSPGAQSWTAEIRRERSYAASDRPTIMLADLDAA